MGGSVVFLSVLGGWGESVGHGLSLELCSGGSGVG